VFFPDEKVLDQQHNLLDNGIVFLVIILSFLDIAKKGMKEKVLDAKEVSNRIKKVI